MRDAYSTRNVDRKEDPTKKLKQKASLNTKAITNVFEVTNILLRHYLSMRFCNVLGTIVLMMYSNCLTFNSKAPTEIPAAAPDPASPMKCSLPMLLAKRDAPT